MTPTVQTLNNLYSDAKTCAQLVGLSYIEGEDDGIARVKHGKGFTYKNGTGTIHDKKMKARIATLAIPPAWQEVWICPSPQGHILATGVDEKGRKQYIYHPKWRTMRDLIKFYRMISFARALPTIRRTIDTNLDRPGLPRDKVIAIMLWILDNTYIRIGNETYLEQNDSVGLTTLGPKNLILAGPVAALVFKGKAGKDQHITFEDKKVATILNMLSKVAGDRLFAYETADEQWQEVSAEDINAYLHELTGQNISAKDFRTWGGTLMAYLHLLEEHQSEETKKPEKVVVEAVDQAAGVLGNTRAVARSSYVHPDLLAAYGSKNFQKYYAHAAHKHKRPGLDRHETELRYFLEQLFEEEFELLKK